MAADQYDQAADVVAKLDLGPRLARARSAKSRSFRAFWTRPATGKTGNSSPAKRSSSGLIGQLEGVVWSLVSINRPQTRNVAARRREADGIRLHRDRGQTAIALSDRPVDPRNPGRLRARADARVDHGDGHARQQVFRLRQPRGRRRLAQPGSRRRARRRDPREARVGSRACEFRSRCPVARIDRAGGRRDRPRRARTRRCGPLTSPIRRTRRRRSSSISRGSLDPEPLPRLPANELGRDRRSRTHLPADDIASDQQKSSRAMFSSRVPRSFYLNARHPTRQSRARIATNCARWPIERRNRSEGRRP